MTTHEQYMHRGLQLASQAAGLVAPNPMVGAVLVHNDRIIGEGYHKVYGQAHAEVNCIHSVKAEDQHLISQSTLYVTLEPCAHFGKTPPCADLVIEKSIPHVVIACRDPFEQVNGKGIEKLKAAGIQVTLGVLEQEAKALNKRFFTFHTRHQPYIILKWAQSFNGKIGNADHSRLAISNEFTNRIVHKWRSEEAAILVGTDTALYDDPALTNRLWNGPNPMRLVIDNNLRLPSSLQLFDRKVRTVVFNTVKHEEQGNLLYYKVEKGAPMLQALTALNIQSVLVEGGAKLLQSFIGNNWWSEMRVITNNELIVPDGIAAPQIGAATLVKRETIQSDTIHYFTNPQNPL